MYLYDRADDVSCLTADSGGVIVRAPGTTAPQRRASTHAALRCVRARRVMSTPSPPSYVKSYAEQAQQVGPREGTVRRARDIAARAVFL